MRELSLIPSAAKLFFPAVTRFVRDGLNLLSPCRWISTIPMRKVYWSLYASGMPFILMSRRNKPDCFLGRVKNGAPMAFLLTDTSGPKDNRLSEYAGLLPGGQTNNTPLFVAELAVLRMVSINHIVVSSVNVSPHPSKDEVIIKIEASL